MLGFPCNQFGSQEPGTADEIRDFCEQKFSVTFPLFAKIDVNGPDTHPLYQQLKSAKPGLLGSQDIKWNFTKFLVSRDGEVQNRYGSQKDPNDLEPEIQRLLDKGYHIESEDTHRHTALSEAACQGHNELIAWLINDLGADPNTKNDVGRSPLWRAAFMGHTETVNGVEAYPLLKLRKLKGFLGLQNHGGGVSFRNIRIGPALSLPTN